MKNVLESSCAEIESARRDAVHQASEGGFVIRNGRTLNQSKKKPAIIG